MLGKLLKYDFRSLSRTLVPMQLGVLGLSLLCSVFLTINMRWSNANTGAGMIGNMFDTIVVLFTVIVAIAIISSLFVAFFLVMQRFYRSILSDEGYLTFTLPVSTTNIMWSKLITGFVWILVSTVVVVLSVLILVLIGSAESGIVNMDAIREISLFFSTVFGNWRGAYTLGVFEALLCLIIGSAAQLLQLYFSIIVGGMLSKKHRILAAIGSYFVINFAIGSVSSIISIPMGISLGASSFNINTGIEVFWAVQPYIVFSLVLLAASAVLFFFLSRYFLKNRLNLE